MIERARAQKTAQLFKLVSSPTRVMILRALFKKEVLPVQSIANAVEMTHSAVSHQLGVLAEGNIVNYEQTGREIRYSLANNKEANMLAKLLKVA